MADDSRYEMALQTALAILHELATRPGMSGPEKLSAVTFTVLRTIHEAEESPPRRVCSRLWTTPPSAGV